MEISVSDVLPGELLARLGGRVVNANADAVHVTIPVAGNTQPFGLLHGGANAFLVEDAGSRLALLNAPAGMAPAGSELNVSHIRANITESATGIARVIGRTRSSIIVGVDITDSAGKLTATGRLTCVYVRRSGGDELTEV